MTNTVNAKEIEQFSKDSSRWWDEKGPFAPLHRLNPVRMRYIREQIVTHFKKDQNSRKPFEGLNILDIGCGGGLVCEPLSRLGGHITGLDADPQAIETARNHAEQTGLEITYQNHPAEEHLKTHKGRYDVVLALEILEHVSDIPAFIKSCASLCTDNGLIIFSTLNRTPQSFAKAIVAAEYILGWVPRGTHDWKKFIKPSELSSHLRILNMSPADLTGLEFMPLTGEFSLSKNVAVNYFITAKKDA